MPTFRMLMLSAVLLLTAGCSGGDEVACVPPEVMALRDINVVLRPYVPVQPGGAQRQVPLPYGDGWMTFRTHPGGLFWVSPEAAEWVAFDVVETGVFTTALRVPESRSVGSSIDIETFCRCEDSPGEGDCDDGQEFDTSCRLVYGRVDVVDIEDTPCAETLDVVPSLSVVGTRIVEVAADGCSGAPASTWLVLDVQLPASVSAERQRTLALDAWLTTSDRDPPSSGPRALELGMLDDVIGQESFTIAVKDTHAFAQLKLRDTCTNTLSSALVVDVEASLATAEEMQ